MGKPPSQPVPTVHHFSHQHPLQLTNHQSQLSLFPVTCSCCKQKASGWIYNCTMCNYFLHVPCSQMPQEITHPFDQNHVLSLLPTPAYPEGSFNCDSCGKKGDGFCYHCGTCNIDLHPNCASMPMIITHQSHHHQLNLIFSIPYPTKSFNCDVCNTLGSKQWLYRCNLCGFDIHIDCAKIDQGPAPVQVPYPQQVQVQNSYLVAQRSVPVQAPLPVQQAPVQNSYLVVQTSVPVQAPLPVQQVQVQNSYLVAQRLVPVQAFLPVQQVPVQHYQTSPSPVASMYQIAGNPVAIRPPLAATGHPQVVVPGPAVQSYVPNNYVNTAAPVAPGSRMNMPVGGSGQQVNFLSNQNLLRMIDSACQSLGQNMVQGLFGGGGGGGGSGGGGGGGGGGGVGGGGFGFGGILDGGGSGTGDDGFSDGTDFGATGDLFGGSECGDGGFSDGTNFGGLGDLG